MFRDCIDSLTNIRIPDDCDVMIVVVQSGTIEETDYAGDILAASERPWPFVIDRATRSGIAAARNIALEQALALYADWVVFIDDDEIAARDWLVGLMAPNYRDTPILAGKRDFVFPAEAPPTYWDDVSQPAKRYREGRAIRTCTGGNVRINAHAIGDARFDERIGYMGGEDIEFFGRLSAAGLTIRETQRALTWEYVHPERRGFRAHMYRWFWCAASDVVALQLIKGRRYAAFYKLHTIPANFILGVILLPFSIRKGMKKLAKAAGRAAAFAGRLPEPYRNVVGS